MKTDRQSDFNLAYRGVLGQKGPGVSTESQACVYFRDEKSCGIGFILRETVEDWPAFNRWGEEAITDLLLIEDETFDFLPDRFYKDALFYAELQAAHDEAWQLSKYVEGPIPNFLRVFRKYMAAVAEKYGLEVPNDI